MPPNKSTPLDQNNQQAQQSKAKRKFRAKQRLTLPLLSIAHTPIMMVQVIEAMYLADITVGVGKEAEQKPTVCKVLSLDTETEGLLICNKIIQSALEKVEGGYVGKVFSLRGQDIRDGKRYRDVDIVLMEEDKG